MLKCLVIVDDANHESIAIVVEHCMGDCAAYVSEPLCLHHFLQAWALVTVR
jgi:hypothetical protein